MLIYILLFLCLLTGALAGFFTGMRVLKPKDSYPAFEECGYRQEIKEASLFDEKYATEHHADMRMESEDNIASQNTKNTSMLQEKLSSRKQDPMVEFNCAADGIDKKEYIKKRQDKEDSSYSILKDKRKQQVQENGTA